MGWPQDALACHGHTRLPRVPAGQKEEADSPRSAGSQLLVLLQPPLLSAGKEDVDPAVPSGLGAALCPAMSPVTLGHCCPGALQVLGA